MKKLFTLISVLVLTFCASAQTQHMYEWKNGHITVRTVSEVDSITFSLPADAVTFTTGNPSALAESSMTASYSLVTSLAINNSGETTEQGVCYSSENDEPTIADSKVVYGTMYKGTWNITLSQLCGGCVYYYRPYLKIADAVFYGPVKSFTALGGNVDDSDALIFKLVYNGRTVADGETLNIKATIVDFSEYLPDCYLVNAYTNDENNNLNIHNLTSKELSVTVTAEVLEDVAGTSYALCSLGTCSPVTGGYATKTGTILANGEEKTKWEIAFTYGIEGIARTKLTVAAGGFTRCVYVNFVYKTKDVYAVDLGLPSGTLWADRNVGADAPEAYGDYFAWGETEPKSSYSWATYKWCYGSYDTQTKYCISSSYGTVDGKTTLDLEDDAAYVNMGSEWRMPTITEQRELLDNCTWTWTTQNGVYGRMVTGSNGNSIFLPATGFRYNSILGNAGSVGEYWSSSLEEKNSNVACDLSFSSGNYSWFGDHRCSGQAVRAVVR